VTTLEGHGRWGIFVVQSIKSIFSSPFRLKHLMAEVKLMGYDSVGLIAFTAVFTGMVLGLQGYTTLKNFGSEGILGLGATLTLFSELGPVLTALLLIGRAGSSMCAGLGVMRISDQISAMDTMGIDSFNYLIGPKFLACAIIFPILSFMFSIVGVGGSYMAGVMILGVNHGSFYNGVVNAMANEYIVSMCFYKSLWFGFLMASVCGYKGYTAGCRGTKSAEGVSKATTEAVVFASVYVLLWDYLITSLII
jgi:phospholipid/cholesterol/gamma-HCH transport system permease protein